MDVQSNRVWLLEFEKEHTVELLTRGSKIVSRVTGRRAVTSVDHSRCAVVLKEIQRYHGPGLWAWRKNFFTPERHQFYNNTLSHIFGAIP